MKPHPLESLLAGQTDLPGVPLMLRPYADALSRHHTLQRRLAAAGARASKLESRIRRLCEDLRSGTADLLFQDIRRAGRKLATWEADAKVEAIISEGLRGRAVEAESSLRSALHAAWEALARGLNEVLAARIESRRLEVAAVSRRWAGGADLPPFHLAPDDITAACEKCQVTRLMQDLLASGQSAETAPPSAQALAVLALWTSSEMNSMPRFFRDGNTTVTLTPEA